MKYKKIIIIIAIFFLIPLGVQASFTARVSQNNVEVEGNCLSADATITLAKTDNPSKIVYSGGVPCQNGKFSFADDLLKWNMDDGKYNIMVNGQKSGKTVERKEQTLSVQDEPVENPAQSNSSSQVATPASPEIKFLNAFVTLQQSMLDMRQWLAETKYPAFVKGSMEFALDGVDFAVAKVSALVLSSESSENAPESNPAEAAISATDIPAETPATVTPIESTQPLIPDPSIGTDEATVN